MNHLYRLLVFSIFIFSYATLMHADSSLVYTDYLKPILNHELKSATDVWENTKSGGYLFRFQMDVTGDGQKEIFVTSSLNAFRLDATWNVFQADKNGRFTPFDKTVRLPMNELRVEQTDNGPVFVQWSESDRIYAVTKTRFRGHNILTDTETVPFNDFIDGKQAKLLESTFLVQPPLEAIALIDFLNNPDGMWMPVKSLATNADGYVVIPDDAERLNRLSMTPQEAVALLENLAPSPSAISRNSQTVTTNTSPSPLPSTTQSPPAKTAASTSVPKFPLTALVVLLLGVIVYLIRRKKT